MRCCGRWLVAVALCSAGASASVQAQIAPRPTLFRALEGAQLIGSIDRGMQHDVGQKIVAKIAAGLLAAGETPCVDDKKLDHAAYTKLAVRLLGDVDRALTTFSTQAVDAAKANALFDARVRPEALVAYRSVLSPASSSGFRVVAQSRVDMDALVRSSERLAQAMTLARYKLPKPLLALEDGDDSILLPLENFDEGFDEALKKLSKPDFLIFAELAAVKLAATEEATNVQALLGFGPSSLIPMLGGPLSEHCITPQR